MRLRLETTPEELQAKGAELIKALADVLGPVDYELAERLTKALPPREHDLKHEALRAIHERVAGTYADYSRRMLDDIAAVLEKGLPRKSQTPARGSRLVKAELPEALGADLWEWFEKGAGHKYIRRVPTGNPKRPWRYFYDVTGGQGLGHKGEMLEGAKFQIKHGEHAGHYEIQSVDGARLKLKHDESGHIVEMTATELRAALQKEHEKTISKVVKARHEELWRVRLHGTGKQVERIEAEIGKLKALFPALTKYWFKEPMGGPTPPGARADYADLVAAVNTVDNLQFTFALEGRQGPGRYDRQVTLGKNIQAEISELKKHVERLTGFQIGGDATTDEAMALRKAFDKKFQTVLGPDESASLGLINGFIRDAETGTVKGNLIDEMVRTLQRWSDYLHFHHAKADLAADANAPLTAEVAILQGKFTTELRKAYYEDGRGTRTAFNALTDMIASMRTQRGVAALKQLTATVYDRGKHSAERMRELLGYSWGDALKQAEKAAAANKARGYGNLVTTIDKPVAALNEAIEADKATVRAHRDKMIADGRRGQVGEGLFGLEASRRYGVKMHDVETRENLIDHRFNNIAPQQSAVGKLFRERFGATVYLNEETFDALLDNEVRTKDYNTEDLTRYREPKERKKLLETLDAGQRERAKRFWGLADNQFGYHAGASADDWKWAQKGEKAAFNECKAACEVSRQSKERALTALYHALEDMEEALGAPLDLSGLPLVLSDRHVGAGANAHYMSGYTELFEREKMGKPVANWDELKNDPHIALHTGFEKSLAHELMHYLDNRVTVRVAFKKEDPNALPFFSEAAKNLAEARGMPEGEWAEPWLEKNWPEGNEARKKIEQAMFGARGMGYLSNMASLLVRGPTMPEFQSEAGKEYLAEVRRQYLKAPGAESMLALHDELAAIGAYEDYRKRDETGSAGDMSRLMSEITGNAPPEGEKAIYYQTGTEVLARVVEQYVHAEMAKRGKLNPSLTHVNYAPSGERLMSGEEGAQYIDPDVFAEKIAPKARTVLDFYTEHMTKALEALEADDADALLKAAQHKYIRRIPTGRPKPKYRYVYAASAASASPPGAQAGEKIRIKQGDHEGHYEVTEAYPNGWVTLKHDETGHTVTARQEWVKDLFLAEYADKHAADRKRLAGTYAQAQKTGSEKQQERARQALADHMQRFPDPAARAAELTAKHASQIAQHAPSPEAHLTAAAAHVEALGRGARGAKARLSVAEQHLEHAKTLRGPRKRGSGKPRTTGELGTKAWSYGRLMESIEESADFSAADAAYRRWKGEGDKAGPKPSPWAGGELDAPSQFLERRVSSPREAWDLLTVGAKKWTDPRVAEAIEIMREIPGYENLRLPDDIVGWMSEQTAADYESALAEEYVDGFPPEAFDFPFGANVEDTEEAITKADPGEAGGFEDYTEAIAEKDRKAYARVKVHLQRKGYKPSDFDEGGPLFGWSLNALLDLARDRTQ